MKDLNKKSMHAALKALDEISNQPFDLIVGGGGAMVMAYSFPLGTQDIDAYPKGIELSELDQLVKTVSKRIGISPSWLNTYFVSFSYSLPNDYQSRLVSVFQGRCVHAFALGKEDLLIMKCFAHRPKDFSHAKALIKKGADVHFVEKHLENLKLKGIALADEAMDFLNEVVDACL